MLLPRGNKIYYENRKALSLPRNHSSILICCSLLLLFHGLLLSYCTSFRTQCSWVAAGTRKQTCREQQHQELEGRQGTGISQRQLQGWRVRKKELISYKVHKRNVWEPVTQNKLTGSDLKTLIYNRE